MSGGAFDYDQYKIGDIASQIEERLQRNGPEAMARGAAEDDWVTDYKPETVKRLKEAVRFLRIAEIYAQRADWFFSGDDGEESFHRNLDEDLAKIEQDDIEKGFSSLFPRKRLL